jgi:hypothetical protein
MPSSRAEPRGQPVRITSVEIDLADDVDKTFYRVVAGAPRRARYLGRPIQLVECEILEASAPGQALVVRPAALTVRVLGETDAEVRR